MMKLQIEFMDEEAKWSNFSREAEVVPRVGERFSGTDDVGAFCDGTVAAVTHVGGSPDQPLVVRVTVHQGS